MKQESYSLGKKGEEKAATYLKSLGLNILAMNFRCPERSEIDIIALAQDIETIIFVEVKTWQKLSSYELEYSISRRKRENIILASQYYLKDNPQYNHFHYRYDLIFLNGLEGDIEHKEAVFF